jgi:thiamine biosynthesis lipoprotein
MNRKVILAVLGIACVGLVVGCIIQSREEQEQRSCSKQLFAMDTYMEFTAYGRKCEEAVDAAIEEIKTLDALLSTGSDSSEISRLNAAGSLQVSGETAVLLEKAQEIYQDTDGIFDCTIYPVMKLWGFPTQEYHVATEEELKEILPLVDGSKVEITGNETGAYVTLAEGQETDLGGIAKGYAAARVMEIFEDYDVASGIVSLGGNIQVLNTKPDGSKWNIGIRNPEGSASDSIASVSVENKALVTSGGYERYFEENGETYIHIIDPRTGYPAEGDLCSVTIVSGDGTLADALSTSLYIMGLEKASEYWRQHKTEFDAVLITTTGEIYITEGIQDDFHDISSSGNIQVIK